MKQTPEFNALKEQWDNTEHHEAIEWMSGGNNLQRHFYMLNGLQIIENTFFPYNWMKSVVVYFWLDMLVENTPENIALLQKYGARINMEVSYTDIENVGTPQFDDEDKMLLFIVDGLDKKLNAIPSIQM